MPYRCFLLLVGLHCFLLASCANENDKEDFVMPQGDKLLVMCMQGESGAFGILQTSTLEKVDLAGPASNDAVARTSTILGQDYLFVLNRLTHDNVQVLRLPSLELVTQYSTGSKSNPQDIVVMNPTSALVSLLGKDYLLHLDPLTGKEKSRVDLSAYVESNKTSCVSNEDCPSSCLDSVCQSDGLPEAAKMVRVGEKIWVVIQRLDRFSFFRPAEQGLLLVLDSTSLKVERVLKLQGKNPTDILIDKTTDSVMVLQTGQWFEGSSSVYDGLIERIDTKTFKQTVITTEKAHQLNFSRMIIDNKGSLFLIASQDSKQTRVVQLDKTGGTKREIQVSSCKDRTTCYDFFDIALSKDETRLFIVDRHPKKPGVRVFALPSLKEEASSPIPFRISPISLVPLP